MDLLFPEYEARLSEAAALYGAAGGAAIRNSSATWKARLSGLTVSVDLGHDGSGGGYMVPTLRVGSSSSLPMDPMAALTILRECEDVILRASAAHISLERCRVWFRDAPCNSCSGKAGRSCSRCGGRGVRNEVEK